MGDTNFIHFLLVSGGLMLAFLVSFSLGFTYDQDVYAINNLYASLGSPPLPGWVLNGGDPCVEGWQGVQCVNSNITGIVLNGANLGGELGDKLWNFSSIITIDLSNNHVGGNIPLNLPHTIRKFFLSDNQLTGRIPSSLSTLALLSDLSLNNNHLNGVLPDAFQSLTDLINLDISFNNLSGQLPSSLGNLSSLTTLHMQNNQLSGYLDILQDLPLQDLNVENNLFWGPVPGKLFNIPSFRKNGNPFNTTVLPSPPLPPPPLPPPPSPLSEGPTSGGLPGNTTDGPSAQNGFQPVGSKKSLVKKTTLIAAMIVVLCIIVVLLIWSCWKCNKKMSTADGICKRQEITTHKSHKEKPQSTEFLIQQTNQVGKVLLVKNDVQNPTKEHQVEMTKMGVTPMPQHVDKVIVNPITATKLQKVQEPSTSLMLFTIASLQQYTNSFAREHLIREETLGNVYHAVLPDGQQLAVKTLNKAIHILLRDEDFLNLVLRISELRHDNVIELVGYCMEHGQRILVYHYCSSQTLEDVLHCDEFNKKLSWNDRIKIALGGARALEYLHEICQPPIMHRNFKSSALLLDDKLTVRASNCGLARLISSASVNELSGYIQSSGYDAPEFMSSRKYTLQSDIYSFGVIMLELLTGRKSYDSSRPRGEHHLARWAINQLHDIELLSRMVDPNLSGTYSEKSLSRFADIISLCLEPEPEFRPPMSEIVQMILHMIQREALRNQ
eukprot:TRINITY_DN3490_c0_g1_i9.p1 TRINITY_DN3490_c0_g1~~TRINITY_DN3490_c0_g1_i9.p1  ORF type:complete len:723 (+),score=114.98 TRINITY_DN3490_c0_g1_i9:286-2454(+)